MVAPKDEHLALSSGIGLAGLAVSNFWDDNQDAFSCLKEEIIGSIIKPTQITAIHHYLLFFQDIEEEVDDLSKNIDDMEWVYNFLRRTLNQVNLQPDIPEPDFKSCGDKHGHLHCVCNDIIHQWINYINDNKHEIDDLIVHSAFQFIFQDRKFLHDFHLELSYFIKQHLDEIEEKYSEYVTTKKRIKRVYFPKWLTDAVFYRDKGTCSICRCDLTKLIRTQNTTHIDHIVPLDICGSNDASNFQLLCETCNTSKGARSTTTNPVNVPFWNLN